MTSPFNEMRVQEDSTNMLTYAVAEGTKSVYTCETIKLARPTGKMSRALHNIRFAMLLILRYKVYMLNAHHIWYLSFHKPRQVFVPLLCGTKTKSKMFLTFQQPWQTWQTQLTSALKNLTNSPSISHDKLAALVVVEPVPVRPPTTTATSSGTVLSDLLKVENVRRHLYFGRTTFCWK